MKKCFLLSLIFSFFLGSLAHGASENTCSKILENKEIHRAELYTTNGNPLLRESDAPFGAPRYDLFELEQVIPAYELGLKEFAKYLAEVRDNKNPPTFENTILALEESPLALDQAGDFMFMLGSSNNSPEYMKVSEKTREMTGPFQAQIFSDQKLFARVKAVYDQRHKIGLSAIEVILVEQTYESFEDSGMTLLSEEGGEAKFERKTEILQELSMLSSEFSKNNTKLRDAFQFRIDNEEDLKGLPDPVVENAKRNAVEADAPDSWIFMNRDSSSAYVLSYSEVSEVRKRFYKSSLIPADFPNYEIVKNIARLRHELALLLGYKDYSEMVMEDLMAEHPKRVHDLVDPLAEKALELAKAKRQEFLEFYEASGGTGEVQAWDRAYWGRLYSNHQFSFDPEIVREYFPFDKAFEGTLKHFSDSYDIDFILRDDIPPQHEDATVYELRSRDTGESLGVMYFDLFKRDGKEGGAHQVRMRAYKDYDGEVELPLIRIVANYDPPQEEKPSLLRMSDVETLFHELGHGMDSLFSRAGHPGLSRLVFDAIEVPSQAQEGFVQKREVLDRISAHTETGEPLPEDLLAKIMAGDQYYKSFQILAQITQIKLDFSWHSEQGSFVEDVEAFENQVSAPYRVNPTTQILPGESYSVGFRHIFSTGYASKYYSYLWSDVLAAHVFHRLSRHPMYSDQYKQDFKDYTSKFLFYGQTRPVLESFVEFMDEEPDVSYLLKGLGLE